MEGWLYLDDNTGERTGCCLVLDLSEMVYFFSHLLWRKHVPPYLLRLVVGSHFFYSCCRSRIYRLIISKSRLLRKVQIKLCELFGGLHRRPMNLLQGPSRRINKRLTINMVTLSVNSQAFPHSRILLQTHC